MKISKPTILVIVGISGDLSKRKLLPATDEIFRAGELPEKFKVIGVTRRDIAMQGVELYKMDLEILEEYKKLARHLDSVEKDWGTPAQRLFYLSVPPQVSQSIVRQLGQSGLAKVPDTKLLLEKPFGFDLQSAKDLIDDINKYFTEEQVYRIDHYLAKEMTQNLIIFRQSNSLFKRTWNKDFIERIEIVASEQIGIEGRATFYEQTGALRDLVQSHLLQLAALTLMKIPPSVSNGVVDSNGGADNSWWKNIPDERLRALEQLHLLSEEKIIDCVKRGQYKNYREEVKNPQSTVETFVSLQLESGSPDWQGVPITLTTGKALDKKMTEIRIFYKKAEHHESNQLTLRIQPKEGIEICLWTKKPGYDRTLEKHPLNFSYEDHYASLPEAYERVLVDAMHSDHSLFTSSGEVLRSWEIIAPIQEFWKKGGGSDLTFY
ncbi:MAG: glucose-6-phosphate dehydrogenase [Candidatus Pacebacteria bacterium]|nr:glucose-6-phosphate dehydrogenase [Candidatus Paceibacterota bacterium]